MATGYPNQPGSRETDTSRDAAASMEASASTLRQMCVRSLRNDGPGTADGVAGRVGVSILSIRPRFTELKRDGKIVDTGHRAKNDSGRNAIVWAIK